MRLYLKAKVLLILFIFIALPITVLGFLSYQMTAESLQNTIEEELAKETRLTAETIQLNISSLSRVLKITSNNSSLIRVLKTGDGNIRFDSFSYLSRVIGENKDIVESMILLDKKGNSILSNSNVYEDTDIRDRAYVKEALKGETTISKVVISKITNKPVIAIAQPIKDGEEVLGLLIGSIDFNTISNHVADIKVGKDGYGYMVNKDGLVVYHPNNDKILKENLGESESKELNVIVEKMKKDEIGEGFYTYEGIYKYVSYHPVENWIVAITAEYNDYMSAAMKIRNDTIIIGLATLLIAMVLGYFIVNSNLVKPIKQLQTMMGRAGNGDLTAQVNIKTRDEIEELAMSYNAMMESQSNIIGEVRNSAEVLAASSEELAASSEEVSATTEQISANINQVASNADEQNKSIVETSQALVQLSSLVQLAKNKAGLSNERSIHTLETTEIGRKKVADTVNAMGIISENTDSTERILKELNTLSDKVNVIINTINSISEQTSLLSLNASIEAARAGEHGRGFTVVAEEIRKLSEESNRGANEIAEIINEMVGLVDNAVESMSKGKDAVMNGERVTKETDEAFVNIKNAIEEVAKNIQEIVDITNDEVATSDQIVELINSVASITEVTVKSSHEVASGAQEQSAATETLAATAEETSSMAVNLDDLVKNFKIRSEEKDDK